MHWTCCQTSSRVAAWSQPQAQAQDVCKLSCLTATACLSIDCTVCSLSNCEDAQSSLGLGPDDADAGAVNSATLGPYAAPPSGVGLQGHLACGSAAQTPPHSMAGTLASVNSWYGRFALPARCCFFVLHQSNLLGKFTQTSQHGLQAVYSTCPQSRFPSPAGPGSFCLLTAADRSGVLNMMCAVMMFVLAYPAWPLTLRACHLNASGFTWCSKDERSCCYL